MPYRQASVGGLPAVSLHNDQVEVVVVPAMSGRITNLRLRRGREWLWRNPEIAFSLPPSIATVESHIEHAYVELADSGGWDECFPTVGACRLPGEPSAPMLTDHGELWYLPWQHQVYEHSGGVTLAGAVTGQRLGYEFGREIVVPSEGSEVVLKYRLRHLGETPFPFLWSAHPLLNVQPGTQLELAGVSRVKVATVHGRDDLSCNDTIRWPLDGDGGAYEFTPGSGWAVKLFAELGGEGVMRLTDPQRGEQLELRVSPREVPQVGLWINSGGWSPPGKRPYYNLALEPCIGAPDRLDLAITEWRMASILLPGSERVWSVTVTLRE